MESFEGGSEAFLNVVWSTRILDGDSFANNLSFLPIPRALQAQLNQALGSDVDFDLKVLFKSFLQATGVPSPQLWPSDSVLQQHFSDLIPLRAINTLSFRSKMLCWAATGSTSLHDGQSIQVMNPCHSETHPWPLNSLFNQISIVDTADIGYHMEGEVRQGMVDHGKLSFRTCAAEVRLPCEFLVRLLRNPFSIYHTTATRKQALHHWLLTELLTAVGGHTMI